MKRKVLMVAVAAIVPIGAVAATAVTAAAGGVTDPTGAPATASCTSSGGTISFKTPLGIQTAGGYQPPTKNKGEKIKVTGINLTCTSSVVSGSFTGVASGKITSTNPTQTPAQFYSCTNLTGTSPQPGGTLTGSLKIKWTPPVGQKFSAGKSSTMGFSTIQGGTVVISGDTYGQFTIPATGHTATLTGSFPGSDAGATASATAATSQDVAALAAACQSTGGLSSVTLASGTTTLQ